MTKLSNNIANFFKGIFRKYKAKPLLGKVFYTLLLILIFRVASTITVPGVEVHRFIAQETNSFLGTLDLIGGGALNNFSIVSLGIGPYITASIIMTLLQSEAFPAFYRLAQSGPAGKRKINIITRVVTVVFAFIQAITIIQQFRTSDIVTLIPPLNETWYQYVIIPTILVAGSLLALFLGEQITDKGVGNGTSLIIFSGVASGLPAKVKLAYESFSSNSIESGDSLVGLMDFVLYMMVFVVLIYIIGYLYKAERHVPIQQTGSGMTSDVNQMSRLPIKLNPAGVMPIIFAFTITLLPQTIVQFLDHQNGGRRWIEEHLQLTSPIGLLIFVTIVFLFSVVMALVTFNPFTISENFKKNGTFIPGVRPGNDTEKYLTGIVIRLALFSAAYLSIISSVQFVQQILGLSSTLTISGTSLIILVSVAVETLDQIKARDTTHNISKAKRVATASIEDDSDSSSGLLW